MASSLLPLAILVAEARIETGGVSVSLLRSRVEDPLFRRRTAQARGLNLGELEHPRDLRAVIAAALAATPVDEVSLRRGVWAYVRAERDLGASPRSLVAVLTELVDASKFGVLSARRSVMRWMIHSCVQAYFGHHADEVFAGGDYTPGNISRQTKKGETAGVRISRI